MYRQVEPAIKDLGWLSYYLDQPDAIEEALTKSRVKPNHIEGYPHGDWLLMDYVDFVVHVFTPKSRSHYDLERLWGDAGRLEIVDTDPGDRDESHRESVGRTNRP